MYCRLLITFLLAGQVPQVIEHPDVRIVVSIREIKELTKAIGSSDASIQIQAIQSLRRLQIKTPEMIREGFSSQNPTVLSQALLWFAEDAEEEKVLVKARDLQKMNDRELNAVCLEVVSTLSLNTATDELIRMSDPSLGVSRAELIDAWNRHSHAPPPGLLTALVFLPSGEIDYGSAGLVRKYGNLLGNEHLSSLLDCRSGSMRASAINWMGGELMTNGLAEQMLIDRSPQVRREAINVMARGPMASEILRRGCRDDDSSVRETSLRLIEETMSTECLESVIERLGDAEQSVSILAERILERSQWERLNDLLASTLTNTSSPSLAGVIRVLTKRKYNSMLGLMMASLSHSDEDVRTAAIYAVGAFGSEGDVKDLIGRHDAARGRTRAALNDVFGTRRIQEALGILGRDIKYPENLAGGAQAIARPADSGPVTPVTDGAFIETYSEVENGVATSAIRAIAKLKNQSVVPLLVELASDVSRNEECWFALAYTLAQLGSREAAGALEQLGIKGFVMTGPLVVDMTDRVRVRAIDSIRELGLKQLVPELLGTEPAGCSLIVRRAISRAASELTGREYIARKPGITIGLFLRSNERWDQSTIAEPVIYVQQRVE